MIANLVSSLNQKCRNDKLTVAAAESLTGGALSAALCSVPSSSVALQGAIVAYTNQLKIDLLDVPPEIIEEYTEISDQCVRAMAEGVKKRLKVEAAAATTGLVVPDEKHPDKPAGMVWIAIATNGGTISRCFNYTGTPQDVVNQTVESALKMLLESACGSSATSMGD